MNLQVNGHTLETDNNGFLINHKDWNSDVMHALIEQHETEGHKPLSETAIGLVEYFREYFVKNEGHPSMNQLIKHLGMQQADSFTEAEEYKRFLYDMFPHGPVQKLSRLAGLPNPGNENES
jgi:tRNA 2-thiouridine synthesizing protein E